MCHIWEMCHIGEMCGRNAVATTVGFQAHSTLDIQKGVSKYTLLKSSEFRNKSFMEKDAPQINIFAIENVRLTYFRAYFCSP